MTRIVPPVVLAVGIPTRGFIRDTFWRAYQALQLPRSAGPVVGATHQFSPASYNVAEARNVITKAAMDADPRVTHVFMLDDDMVPPPDTVTRLLARDLPIVGALCHSRAAPYQPILYRRHGPAPEDGFGFVYDYPRGELIEVDGTGAAALLVKREVFESVGRRFGAGRWWATDHPVGSGAGEDLSFCARAKECGFGVYVDTSLEVGHLGEVTIDSRTAKALRDAGGGMVNEWRPAPVVR